MSEDKYDIDLRQKEALQQFKEVTAQVWKEFIAKFSEPVKVKFKKLHPEATIPKQATDGAAGFDLTAVRLDVFKEFDGNYNVIRYHTGLSVEIPRGYVGLLFPRSSCYKYGLILSNAVGVIDSDFRGEICLMFTRIYDFFEEVKTPQYEAYDRIGQLVIVPCPVVEFVEAEELSETNRGTGGFGHTGQ